MYISTECAYVFDFSTALIVASQYGFLEIVDLLLHHKANVDERGYDGR